MDSSRRDEDFVPRLVKEMITDVMGHKEINAMQMQCLRLLIEARGNLAIFAPSGSGKTDLVIMYLMHRIAQKEYGIVVYMSVRDDRFDKALRSLQDRQGNLTLRTKLSDSLYFSPDMCYVFSVDPKSVNHCSYAWMGNGVCARMDVLMIDDLDIMDEDISSHVELIVTRVKMINHKVRKENPIRTIILSDMIENRENVAKWLDIPEAPVFGEELRNPKVDVRVFGYDSPDNIWSFERHLDEKLVGILASFGRDRRVIIFCCSDESSKRTASMLIGRYCLVRCSDESVLRIHDKNLAFCIRYGISFIHSKSSEHDRKEILRLFGNQVSILCTTLTNLKKHFGFCQLSCDLVVIKGTNGMVVEDGGWRTYSRCELLEMAGRLCHPSVVVFMTHLYDVDFVTSIVFHRRKFQSKQISSISPANLAREIALRSVCTVEDLDYWAQSTLSFLETTSPEALRFSSVLALHDLLRNGILYQTDSALSPTPLGRIWSRHDISYSTLFESLDLSPPYHDEKLLDFVSSNCQGTASFQCTKAQYRLDIMANDPALKFGPYSNAQQKRAKVMLDYWMTHGMIEDTDLRHEFRKIRHNALSILSFLTDLMIERQSFSGTSAALTLKKCVTIGIWENSQKLFSQVQTISTELSLTLHKEGYRSFDQLRTLSSDDLEAITEHRLGWAQDIIYQISTIPNFKLSSTQQNNRLVVTIENTALHPQSSDVVILVASNDSIISHQQIHVDSSRQTVELELEVERRNLTIRLIDCRYVGVDMTILWQPEQSSDTKANVTEDNREMMKTRHTTTRVSLDAPLPFHLDWEGEFKPEKVEEILADNPHRSLGVVGKDGEK